MIRVEGLEESKGNVIRAVELMAKFSTPVSLSCDSGRWLDFFLTTLAEHKVNCRAIFL